MVLSRMRRRDLRFRVRGDGDRLGVRVFAGRHENNL